MDRNINGRNGKLILIMSLSARRAWIEMISIVVLIIGHIVALRKESVDRNTQRRDFKRVGLVALRKESVDRNLLRKITITVDEGRSPQGERG